MINWRRETKISACTKAAICLVHKLKERETLFHNRPTFIHKYINAQHNLRSKWCTNSVFTEQLKENILQPLEKQKYWKIYTLLIN